jgi:hypothetical protein
MPLYRFQRWSQISFLSAVGAPVKTSDDPEITAAQVSGKQRQDRLYLLSCGTNEFTISRLALSSSLQDALCEVRLLPGSNAQRVRVS